MLGAFHMPKVRMLAFNSGTTGDDRQPKSLGVFVGAESIDSNTEFIILASTGIWEVRPGNNLPNAWIFPSFWYAFLGSAFNKNISSKSVFKVEVILENVSSIYNTWMIKYFKY